MSADLGEHELLTPAETASLLRLQPRSVLRYGAEGRLEVVRLNARTLRYTRSSVAALMSPANATRPPTRASASKLAEETGRHGSAQ